MSGDADTLLARLSAAMADAVQAAAGCVVLVRPAGARPCSGILWRADVVVSSEQLLPLDGDTRVVLPGGTEVAARPAGRDPGTNIAAFRLEPPAPAAATLPAEAAAGPRPGALALLLGADGAGGATARLGLVHAVGPAWHSMAGGRIDRLIRLDARLSGEEEGGPVLDAAGGLLGLSTSGPRRRALVIPAATVERVLEPLLREGRIARGWLGVSLQPVAIPEALHGTAGRPSGLMVLGLARAGPAAEAGLLPGDILLELDGEPVAHPRAVARALGPDRIGQRVTLRLLRAGGVQDLALTVAARPPAA
jgi:S1-C subfamily serine protease